MDALDVLRILQGIETEVLAASIALMRADQRSSAATERATDLLVEFFGTRGSEGAAMAARATQSLMNGDQVRLNCEVLASDLLAALGDRLPS